MIIFTIFFIVLALILLMVLHELGHFLFAKLFKVEIEEFGIGYPPRIIGKKIGKTIYSLNLLPFGAFVKMLGEDKRRKDKNSFSEKPVWQRAIIIFGGVLSFWIVAFIILTFVAGIVGVPTMVDDNFITDTAKVQIIDVAVDSPAQMAGIKPGDIVLGFDKVGDLQNYIQENTGKEMLIDILSGAETKTLSLIPRANPPAGEGALGVALARVVNFKTAWHKAPFVGLEITIQQTKAIPVALYKVIAAKISGQEVVGVKLTGPIGIGQMMGQALSAGAGNFLMFIVMLSLWLAIANLLPIPALDGGKLLFLAIEAVKGKPVSEKVELKITSVFFILLLSLMAAVTLRDIIGLF